MHAVGSPNSYISDLRNKIVETLKQEYQREIHIPKSEDDKDAAESYGLSFADITVWFYKRNSQQSLEEARYIWDLLPPNPLQKHNLIRYLTVYAEEVIDKHEKYCYYQKKYKKAEKIVNRTHGLIEKIREGFNKSENQVKDKLSEVSPNDNINVDDSVRFTVYLNSLEKFNPEPLYGKNSLIGYHIEMGYKNLIVSSCAQRVKKNQLDFRNEPVEMMFSLKEGSIFMNLYEDYEENGQSRKSLVAKRNLDLFTNINEKYLNDMFASEDADLTVNAEDIKPEPFFLKKHEYKSNAQSSKKAKKKSRSGDDDDEDEEDETSEAFVKLNMAVFVEDFRSLEDLVVYYKILSKRKECLETRMRDIRMKASGYKKKLTLMLLPFNDVITFTDKVLTVDRKSDKKQGGKGKPCNIF